MWGGGGWGLLDVGVIDSHVLLAFMAGLPSERPLQADL